VKTLLFCTAYASDSDTWEGRYYPWYEHYKSCGVNYDRLLVIDDGSQTSPTFLTTEEHVKLTPRLGRNGIHNYPGWYRSFAHAINFANGNGFDKIVHCESDSFLLSDKVIRFVNGLSSGWSTFWCPRHSLPESAIQVICQDNLLAAVEFFSQLYGVYVHQCLDEILPYTEIHKTFIGDRYGETNDPIPKNADFSCQTSLSMLHKWRYENTIV
jgi:hypothetical protein